MLDTDLFQTNYLGRDGFKWWIGQVADPDSSGWNKALEIEDPYHSGEVEESGSIDIDDYGKQIFTRRCKVRILGYHTISDENGYILKDEDLPWAHIMVGPGLATQDGNGSIHEYKGGENVLGFFMDGDEAQQPIIIGGFGRGKQVLDSKTQKSPGDCTIKPFTPNVATSTLKQSHKLLSKPKTIPNPLNEEEEKSTRRATSPTTADAGSKDEIIGVESQETAGSKEYVAPQNCVLPIKEVETAIRNALYVVQQVQKYGQFYINLGQSYIANFSKLISGYAKQIAGAIRKILEKTKSFLLKNLGDAINEAISLLPENLKSIVTVGFKQAIESIICVWEKITGNGIFSAVLGLLENIFNGNLIDSLLCTAEKLLSKLLSQFLDPIINEIQGVLTLLSGILSGVEGVFNDAIGKVFEVFDFILSFFECAPGYCRGARTWSFAGPSIPDNAKPENIFKQLQIPNIPELEGGTPLNCDDNILWYLPPIIEIIGGNGIGLPIIRNGKLIGVYVDEPGRGYSKPSPPRVTVRNSSVLNPAGGAKVRAVINDDGGIERFVVTSPGDGYVSQPTFVKASVGGEIINVEDLTLPEDQLTIEKQAAIQSLNITTTQDSNDLNVLPFLRGFEVTSPGIGYELTDVILLDNKPPSDYGLELSINVSPDGSIVEINIDTNNNNQRIRFDTPPEVTVSSDFGTGAIILPIMDFIQAETIETLNDGSIVTQTPNGETFTVNPDEILTISNCPNK